MTAKIASAARGLEYCVSNVRQRGAPMCMSDTSAYFLYVATVMALTTCVGAVRPCRNKPTARAYCLRPARSGLSQVTPEYCLCLRGPGVVDTAQIMSNYYQSCSWAPPLKESLYTGKVWMLDSALAQHQR